MEPLPQPWPWYISGPLIGLTAPALLILSGKTFGLSSSFRHLCSILSPRSKLAYLKENDWRAESWNLLFVAGIMMGAYLGGHVLTDGGIPLLPSHYYTESGILKLLFGGVLVGFGTRYADGCTSGHSITGISNLRWSSLVATICFFAGGLFMVAIIEFIPS
jgi:uncharacterized membrane protein YedE/YeeE